MKKVTVDQLEEGMKLARDVFTENGKLLLPEGFIIKLSFIQKLREHNIDSVYVEDEKAESYVKEEVIYHETFVAIQDLMLSAKAGEIVDPFVAKEIVNDIVSQIIEEEDVFLKIVGFRDVDNYTYFHSVDVSIFAAIIGKLLELDRKQIEDLALAALLHDFGKMKIPHEILNKPAKLTDEEFEEMKKHTIYGYQIVKNMEGISEQVAEVALLHHERLDGSGYPLKLKGDKIPLFAKIVAVADVYDALTADRVYKKKIVPTKAADYLTKYSGIHFDKDIVQKFLKMVVKYPVGCFVVLNTGEIAIVYEENPFNKTRPIVKVVARKEGPPVLIPYFVDLSQDYKREIIDVINY
ncbi:HD-GYP domain-containing protein (c-di-GMP phosphodiesterase class II) [Caldicellulosiruptor bescii]|jgi:HD-GYP domain-containing protein (c-di-GMP phosphodiesterase class II)|uniref:Metal dependent phosphohydrolase n=2 Tax=Caldicellulosiruptor bescii TaxID=31899 RepID=B9MKR7_CALBD|nr:HD-GYP domain-containing protein [Caldicellulosiruptor bescii]ACM60925.1 metal dependent phosphohydrolase [Caldicellulosiruptor bescii DSM 6725]PBC89256.1 HD-GYP domain-containing protein (c-di-GMP phosphodiesterase class II) [Caldicellulosiruptor bescii]PBC91259.1 HD-GYP domain-containing protein (c-di-GMP phosphodiesterase class II) [Caldicellulosiruptor bescii]PBD03327.1 HD-GYP domain-containing protein (c-di-GMP phosphodiesterase class II) [Caldicellulosiruptor bescii]PBD07058.1 HD-GYP 